MQAKRAAVLVGVLVVVMVSGSALADAQESATGTKSGKDAYPQRVIDRPLTLPGSMVEAELLYRYHSMDSEDDTIGLQEFALAATVGVVGDFSFTVLAGGMGGGDVDYTKSGELVADKLVHSAATSDTVFRTTIPLSFEDEDDVIQGLYLGLPTRLTPTSMPIAFFVGDDLLEIGSEGIDVPVNVGIGAQIIDPLWLRVDATLATLSVSASDNDSSLDTVADVQMAWARLLFAIGNKLDVCAVAKLEHGDAVSNDVAFGAAVAGRL